MIKNIFQYLKEWDFTFNPSKDKNEKKENNE